MNPNMKRLWATFYLILCATWCFSAERPLVGVVKSRDLAQYNEVLKGFAGYMEETNASVAISEYGLRDKNVLENIKNQKPDLILTLGTPSLKTISESVNDIPIIFSMVFLSGGNSIKGENVTGVSLNIPIRVQLENLKATIPDRTVIGVIYDPDKNENTVGEARQIATELGLILKAFPVKSEKEIPKIKEMEIDALWLIPDTIFSKPVVVKRILSTSLKNKTPVMGISASYVKAGALLALSCDYEDLGRQSGEIALRILRGEDPVDIPVTAPRETKLYLNLSVAKRLGIRVPKKVVEVAEGVFGK